MKVIVINLKQAEERRKFQISQLNLLGLNHSFVEAINKHNADQQRESGYWKTWQRELHTSEKACFLSHRHCWQIVAKQNQPMLVLEDDAILAENCPHLLNRISTESGIDILNLETRGRKIWIGKSHNSINEIKELVQNKSGAAAYVLWPHCAAKLLKKTENKCGIADAVLWSSFEFNNFQAVPALALQSDRSDFYGIPNYLNARSSIYGDSKGYAKNGTSIKEHITYKYRRFIYQIKLFYTQIFNNHKAKKQKLEIDPARYKYLDQIL